MLDSHPNMEVRIFNPFSRKSSRLTQFVTRMGSVTRRMHNKSFTVDNQATILGGRNIGDEYFEANPDLAFADLDVLAIGPVVKEVSVSFDQYWNSELAYPATVLRGKPPTAEEIESEATTAERICRATSRIPHTSQALRNSNLADKIRRDQVRFYWGDAEIVSDQPEKLLSDFDQTEYHLAPQLKPYFERCAEGTDHFFPLFCPGKRRDGLSVTAQRSGVCGCAS